MHNKGNRCTKTLKSKNKTTYLTPQDIRRFKLNTSNWENRIEKENYGFINAIDYLEVLGVNPDKKNPYEEDVIIKYWGNWLESISISHYEIKTASLPSSMDKIIKNFILKE